MGRESLKGDSGLRTLLTFPHPVNEYASRANAGMMFTLAIVTVALDVPAILFAMVYLFLAAAVAGPTFTPTGQLAVRVIAPKLIRRTRLVAGPPKQFAQAVGLLLSTVALVLAYGFGMVGAAYAVISVLILFAGLEAFAGFCAGCFVFGIMMRLSIIPEETCEKCNNFHLPVSGVTESQASAP